MINRKIIFCINTDWFFLLHRVSIAKSIELQGFKIIVATKDTGKRKEIENLGFDFVNIDFVRKGLNPFQDLKTIIQLYKSFKKEKPHIVYQVTIKPIIYGSIISIFLKINTVNTICGLGYVFSKSRNNLLRKLVSLSYRYVVNSKKAHTFFENTDDQGTFLELGILKQKRQSTVVNGAGVDLKKFVPVQTLNHNKKIVITLPARMLWDKGVQEFIEAAKTLELNFKDQVEFRLYGMIDKGNPKSIGEEYLTSIEIVGYLKWFGFVNDIVSVYENSDIVVLPSYYGEGLPTVLAEACAMSKPIVTTDAVGCRECVDEGVNGFKVPVKSVTELAKAIEKLILDRGLRIKMGKASRLKAEKDFDQIQIIKQYSKVFERMIYE